MDNKIQQINLISNKFQICSICESNPHITPDCSICNESLCTCPCQPCHECTYHFDFCICDEQVDISPLKKKKGEE
jgi:hypothetical protein